MARKKKSAEEGASWMDTYGDMVTLLLCFFVLLYSMSTVDAMKWELVVKSFNPNAEKVSQIVIEQDQNEDGMEVPGGTDVPLDEVEDFEDLYYLLMEAIEQNGLEGDVELHQGEGYTFVNFRDNIFFDGNSAVLKEEGINISKGQKQLLTIVRAMLQDCRMLILDEATSNVDTRTEIRI